MAAGPGSWGLGPDASTVVRRGLGWAGRGNWAGPVNRCLRGCRQKWRCRVRRLWVRWNAAGRRAGWWRRCPGHRCCRCRTVVGSAGGCFRHLGCRCCSGCSSRPWGSFERGCCCRLCWAGRRLVVCGRVVRRRCRRCCCRRWPARFGRVRRRRSDWCLRAGSHQFRWGCCCYRSWLDRRRVGCAWAARCRCPSCRWRWLEWFGLAGC